MQVQIGCNKIYLDSFLNSKCKTSVVSFSFINNRPSKRTLKLHGKIVTKYWPYNYRKRKPAVVIKIPNHLTAIWYLLYYMSSLSQLAYKVYSTKNFFPFCLRCFPCCHIHLSSVQGQLHTILRTYSKVLDCPFRVVLSASQTFLSSCILSVTST